MTDSEIITILERLIHAYPDKQVGKTMLKIYVDELIDIPIHLLARAASQHIRTSPFFPRISDLRQAAQQLAGTIDFSSISPPGVDYLDLEAHQLEKDYFHHAIFDIKKWKNWLPSLNGWVACAGQPSCVKKPATSRNVNQLTSVAKSILPQKLVYATLSGKPIPHSAEAPQRKKQPAPVARHIRQRRLRCDCGKLAIKILLVRVGSDPQYTVQLPLCQQCLSLEENLRYEGRL